MFGLTIDGREPKALFEIFRASNVVHTRRDLDCGDFEVASDERVAVIIERKTWPDLVSSLTSQRLSDQASRIIDKCRETGARPVLLVEHP
jgi:ERCC4-type nuclease